MLLAQVSFRTRRSEPARDPSLSEVRIPETLFVLRRAKLFASLPLRAALRTLLRSARSCSSSIPLCGLLRRSMNLDLPPGMAMLCMAGDGQGQHTVVKHRIHLFAVGVRGE